MTSPNTTLFTAWHEDAGATMSEFGGYTIPLWYKTGPIQEHRAVLTAAGLFDTSHMSELLVEGPDAWKLLQRTLTKDLSTALPRGRSLEPGRATYGFFLTQDGHLLDDAIVMMEDSFTYLVVVNAGMGAPVKTHLLEVGAEMDVAVSDLTGKCCKIDLQGPRALHILKKVMRPTPKLESTIPYFGFVGHFDHLQEGVVTLDGYGVLVSRTGYTGEFGFELFVRPDGCLPLWNALLEAGKDDGLIPCGLGARDSLRAGAKLPLSHQDLGDWPAIGHPWEFALCRSDSGFSKSFIGDRALLAAEGRQTTAAFLGENGRKVEAGSDVVLEDQMIGTVLTCATDMGIDRVDGTVVSMASEDAPEGFKPKGLSCGFIKVSTPLAPGDRVTLRDKRRELSVEIVNDIRPDRTARMPWPTA
jgi:aminomethyltransferase